MRDATPVTEWVATLAEHLWSAGAAASNGPSFRGECSNAERVAHWFEEEDQDFELLEALEPVPREDALVLVGRLMGAAEALDLTVLELIDLADDSPI